MFYLTRNGRNYSPCRPQTGFRRPGRTDNACRRMV